MKKMLTAMMMLLISLGILTGCVDETTEPEAPNDIDVEEELVDDDLVQEEEPPNDQTTDENNEPQTPEENLETHQVILYFSDHNLMDTYRINKEIVVRNGDNIAKATLQEWINGPDHEELVGLLNSDVVVEYIEEIAGVAHVSFSKEIQESNLGSSGELMFAEQLAMIMQQFGYEGTQILVGGRYGKALLGHLHTGEPFEANDPENYLWIDDKDTREIVLENIAFRIFEPKPGTEVKERIVVRGLASVFEGTILYEFEDGHFILDEGFTTASKGAPGWGEFEIIIELDEFTNYSGRVILFEVNAKDGARINELQIPIEVVD